MEGFSMPTSLSCTTTTLSNNITYYQYIVNCIISQCSKITPRITPIYLEHLASLSISINVVKYSIIHMKLLGLCFRCNGVQSQRINRSSHQLPFRRTLQITKFLTHLNDRNYTFLISEWETTWRCEKSGSKNVAWWKETSDTIWAISYRGMSECIARFNFGDGRTFLIFRR